MRTVRGAVLIYPRRVIVAQSQHLCVRAPAQSECLSVPSHARSAELAPIEKAARWYVSVHRRDETPINILLVDRACSNPSICYSGAGPQNAGTVTSVAEVGTRVGHSGSHGQGTRLVWKWDMVQANRAEKRRHGLRSLLCLAGRRTLGFYTGQAGRHHCTVMHMDITLS